MSAPCASLVATPAIDLSMRLAERGVGPAEIKRRTDEYADQLITSGHLWDEPRRP